MAGLPFSRLQLAAALLEYDNEPDDPSQPIRNARESAIFAHLRRQPRIPRGADDFEDLREPPKSRRSTEYLSVVLPSEQPLKDGRRTSTLLPTRSEYEPDSETPAAQDQDVMSSWGLEGFSSQDKDGDPKGKGSRPDNIRAKSELNYNSNDPQASGAGPAKRFPLNRPLSTGDIDHIASSNAEALRNNPSSKPIDYRHSLATELEFAKKKPSTSQAPILVPFPTTDTPPQEEEDDPDNPFILPPPSPNRFSRFDPKGAEQRRHSTASMGSRGMLDAPSYPRTRTASNASFGTRMMIDGDGNTIMAPDPNMPNDDRQLSRLELMRPKVLIMPSPLQSQSSSNPKGKNLRDGFFDTSDGPPLPAGSRPGPRPLTTSLTPSSSFNPRTTMSLSQLTFRQSLMVGGQRDVTYEDIDRSLSRAMNDGEQIKGDWGNEEEEDEDLRPAGKLYGTSLMDNLEARKAEIKGKQRVFKGDERSSMMQRDTFVDSDALHRPVSKFIGAGGAPGPGGAPLLNFEHDGRPGPRTGGQVAASRSVFGVDKIWERELEKLATIQEREREEQTKIDALEAKIAKKKGRAVPQASALQGVKPPSPISAMAPVARGGSPLRPPIARREYDDDSGSEVSAGKLAKRRESTATLGVRGWFAGSDEEDEVDRRNSAASRVSRINHKVSTRSRLPQIQASTEDSDEDEDVPLAQVGRKPVPPAPVRLESDSDDDKPISTLVKQKAPQSPSNTKSGGIPALNFDLGSPIHAPRELKGSPKKKQQPAAKDSSDEDEVPLGLRHPGAKVASNGGDDDDQPLGMRLSMAPNAMAGQQQYLMAMQQQMMMQAQLRNSMAMNQMGMMGAGYGPPFMGGPMSVHSMMPSILQTPIQGQPDYSRVDKWRREVDNRSAG